MAQTIWALTDGMISVGSESTNS